MKALDWYIKVIFDKIFNQAYFIRFLIKLLAVK